MKDFAEWRNECPNDALLPEEPFVLTPKIDFVGWCEADQPGESGFLPTGFAQGLRRGAANLMGRFKGQDPVDWQQRERQQKEYERLKAQGQDYGAHGDPVDQGTKDRKKSEFEAALKQAFKKKVPIDSTTGARLSRQTANQIAAAADKLATAFTQGGGNIHPSLFQDLMIAVHQDEAIDKRAKEQHWKDFSTVMINTIEATFNQMSTVWHEPGNQNQKLPPQTAVAQANAWRGADQQWANSPYNAGGKKLNIRKAVETDTTDNLLTTAQMQAKIDALIQNAQNNDYEVEFSDTDREEIMKLASDHPSKTTT